MYTLLAQETTTELTTEQFTKLIETFGSLGVLGGAILVIFMGIIAFILYLYFNRNRQRPLDKAVDVLSEVSRDKEQELEETKKAAAERDRQHLEGMMAVADAMNRQADISKKHAENEGKFIEFLEASKTSESARDEALSKLATSLDTMTREGSEPLRRLAEQIRDALEVIERIDSRTANWDTIAKALPDFKVQLEGIDNNVRSLLAEAEKRATQPVPTVELVLGETPT